MSEETEQKKPEPTAKQKFVTFVIAVIICVVGFPFYWGFTQGPDNTVDKMFDACLVAGALEKVTKKDTGLPIAHLCSSKEVADQISVKLGLLLLPVVGEDGYEYEIVKTDKDGDTAVVRVKLYNGDKSAFADFKLNKVKNGNFIEERLGRWVLVGVDKGE